MILKFFCKSFFPSKLTQSNCGVQAKHAPLQFHSIHDEVYLNFVETVDVSAKKVVIFL